VAQSSQLRQLIWESMLSADLSYRYYRALADSLQRSDKAAKITVAITSSAAVAGWAIWTTPGFNWLWQVASGVAAIVAVALPIVDPAGLLKMASQLAGGWFSVFRDCQLLWADVDSTSEPQLYERYERIVAEEKRLSEMEIGLTIRRRLLHACEQDVRRYYEEVTVDAKEASPAQTYSTHPNARS